MAWQLKRKFLVNFCLTLHSAIRFPSTGRGGRAAAVLCPSVRPPHLAQHPQYRLLCFAWVNFASVACIRFCFRFVPLLEQRKCCFLRFVFLFFFVLFSSPSFVLFFSLSPFLSSCRYFFLPFFLPFFLSQFFILCACVFVNISFSSRLRF